jgi:signal transduction histidine kinase
MKNSSEFGYLAPGEAPAKMNVAELIARLETFNRGVAHDLRGPLSGLSRVASLSDEAVKRGDLASASRMLGVIAEQADRLVEMVDALFALVRMDATSLRVEAVDLCACARQALEMVSLCREGSGASHPPLPKLHLGVMPKVQADAALLRQVFFNLLSNAAKFSDGRPNALISIEAFESGGEVLVMVKDTGIGFDPERAGELFYPFRRLHGRRYTGSGVGLCLVRHIIEKHGGRVWAQGQIDAGATFTFTLPCLANGSMVGSA